MRRYEYPNFPNVETRQTNIVPPMEGKESGVGYSAPLQAVARNSVPDTYLPQANQMVPGTQVFGDGRGWAEMPQPLDIVQRIYYLRINEGLFYREMGYNASQQFPSYAAVTPSITTPALGARFVNARGRGDIYGS